MHSVCAQIPCSITMAARCAFVRGTLLGCGSLLLCAAEKQVETIEVRRQAQSQGVLIGMCKHTLSKKTSSTAIHSTAAEPKQQPQQQPQQAAAQHAAQALPPFQQPQQSAAYWAQPQVHQQQQLHQNGAFLQAQQQQQQQPPQQAQAPFQEQLSWQQQQLAAQQQQQQAQQAQRQGKATYQGGQVGRIDPLPTIQHYSDSLHRRLAAEAR